MSYDDVNEITRQMIDVIIGWGYSVPGAEATIQLLKEEWPDIDENELLERIKKLSPEKALAVIWKKTKPIIVGAASLCDQETQTAKTDHNSHETREQRAVREIADRDEPWSDLNNQKEETEQREQGGK